MGIAMHKENVERGYYHDETGRWIDTSYVEYRVEISGQNELKHLQRILQNLKQCASAKLETESSVLETQFNMLVDEYTRAAQKYNELHWFKRIFATEPAAPNRENCNAFRSRANLGAAVDQLRSKLNRLELLSPEFGVYKSRARNESPVEYEILMTREDKLNFNELLQRL